jgi:hypothetical protein
VSFTTNVEALAIETVKKVEAAQPHTNRPRTLMESLFLEPWEP